MENTHARLKNSPTFEAEKSVVSSGLGVMLREDEWYHSKHGGDTDAEITTVAQNVVHV